MKILVVVLAIGAAAGVYLYYFNPELGAELTRGTPLEREPPSSHVYKWRDADGEWHVSDEPPPEGTPYQRLEYGSDVNIMPPLEDD